MKKLIERAAEFAAKAHAGITREWTGEPYFTHLDRVAKAVAALGMDDATVAAAYLHDVIEDTDVTYEDLAREFGTEVADLVAEVTAPKVEGNRATRKAADRAHLAKASTRGQTIKLADLLDNTRDVAKVAPPDFAKLYLAEKAAMLTVLTRAKGKE